MAGELKEFLTTLKEKLNIVEVAGNYISLERKGGSWWACCPFHHEKTPSFAINEVDQYYHCFGCGESGDIFKFVQNMENIEFMDAVKLLAERANIEVPQTGFDSRQTVELKRKKDAILKILNDCAHFYLNNLNSGKADEHVAYILKREIPSPIVRRFGLGASLNFYDLPKFLLAKGYDRHDMIDSGAINEVDGKLLDAQGGRLIYPIINAMDEVVAFGGRVLQKTNFAKYKNTKETLVFNKSKTLYNINLLKKLKKEQTINEVIIVEGYMDTISLYQAGFKNVVASMGTSLTQDQARLLKRYTSNVLISYDGDSAGQNANMRGLDILKSNGLNVKVVPLTDGLDPDDMIKKKGAAAYRYCLDNAMPLIDYKLASVGQGFDLTKTDDKRRYVQEAIKVIRTSDSASEQEDLLKSLAEQNVTYELIEHVPVYTIEEMDALGLSRHGVIAKNLFLRDAKGKRHFLVILRGSRSVDMKALQPLLESSKLSFASEDRLKKYLNLERGSVTPFGLLNDAGHVVEVFIDKGLEGAPAVGFHPNENTATVFLPMAEVIRIIQEHGNPIKFIDL